MRIARGCWRVWREGARTGRRVRMEWQPIETAPKATREQPLLGWRQPDGYWSVFYWSEAWKDWCDVWDGEPAPDYPVTHWMPLPEPPTEYYTAGPVFPRDSTGDRSSCTRGNGPG